MLYFIGRLCFYFAWCLLGVCLYLDGGAFFGMVLWDILGLIFFIPYGGQDSRGI